MISDSINRFILSDDFGAVMSLPEQQGIRNSLLFLPNEAGDFVDEDGNTFFVQGYSTEINKGEVTSRSAHVDWVTQAVENILRGEMKKVVISRYIFHPTQEKPDLFSIYQKMVNKYPSACVFLIKHPVLGSWIGATPELLLAKKEKNYHTYSLAGTIKARVGEEPNWTNKLRDEQALVTSYIVDALNKMGATDITTDGPKDHKAGPLIHLKTDIQFQSTSDLHQILRSLHPTSAVCGMPLHAARDFISKVETHNRGLYTGYFGVEYKNGDAEFFVALRCMRILSDGFGIYVGGGITEFSNPEDEWNETEIKSRVMLDILQ
jgi:isochorismate synthase